MKHVAVGVHLRREDIEPLATPIAAGELFFSAVAVPDDQPLGDRDLLVRVANVRAQLLERATFIAVRYGYTFAREVDAQQLGRWKRVLEANSDRVEMTIKVAAASPRPRPDRAAFTSGAEYLRALHEATQGAAADPRFREEAERLLLPHAVQYRWTHRDEKSLELTLLVARGDVDAVRSAGGTLKETGVPFLLSGPWPLEAFADADHE
ncbi:MAG TPA: hypothetical protein VKB93_15870 [Thermoanaerobaculia bacterium]|nr:hypothetical protein [Thermoanaerobaculia bacterium]